MDSIKQAKLLSKEQDWNHNFNIFGFETRPGFSNYYGKNYSKSERLKFIFDAFINSKSNILDIGCNEGYFSYVLANRCKFILGIDSDRLRIKKAKFIKNVYHLDNVKFRSLNIYSKSFCNLPTFDVSLCLGLLHRIPNPIEAINSICEKSNTVIFEWKSLNFSDFDLDIGYYSNSNKTNNIFSKEYWILSPALLKKILMDLNFKYIYLIEDTVQKRSIVVASKLHNSFFDNNKSIFIGNKFRLILQAFKRFIFKCIYIIKR